MFCNIVTVNSRMQDLQFDNFLMKPLRCACCIIIVFSVTYLVAFSYFLGNIKGKNGLEVKLDKIKCRIIHSHEE
jgi:hypothetical protein